MLGLVGEVIELDESLIDAATAIMGCSPGYLALMAEVLVEAGVREGLTEDQTMRMVAQGDERHRRSARAARARRAQASGRLARRDDRGGPGRARGAEDPRDPPGRRRRLARAGAQVSLLLAITRDDVANYVSAVFLVYFILIFIRILLSWIPRMPYYPWLRATVDFIHQVVDPYLNIFRRVIPPIGAGGMGIDISPILAIIVLSIVWRVVVALIAG